MAAKVLGQLEALAAPHLADGERVLGGVRVNKKGTVRRAALFGGIGGVVGGALSHNATTAGTKAQAVVGLPPAAQMALAVTDHRLLVFSRSAMSGKPKDLLMSVPIDHVVGVALEPAKLVPKLTMEFADGNAVEFEAIKLDKPEDFAAALHALIARRTA
ncbi:MAG: hypothetical protein ACT4OX_11745 [Actinomycetota bacterium]